MGITGSVKRVKLNKRSAENNKRVSTLGICIVMDPAVCLGHHRLLGVPNQTVSIERCL
ncbi:hypothetical protein IF1G_00242 [Cordyceps javanica]|uniref:Uncharacterized protein n=1 Tax=Cordyceps javanica TaxID=43265 RepID=A0A545VF16_9HYPO|nr:hypothetical protein IF1G_00242 [Cordyceps javanica]